MANITRYNPFSEMVSLREAMDRLFEDSFISPRSWGMTSARGLGANLYETADNFTVQLPAAGVKPEDVEITAQQDTLTVKWETKVEIPENATTHWHGFQSSRYQQTFTLPAPIDSERAEASMNDGILTLTLPKAEHAKVRTVKVNTTEK